MRVKVRFPIDARNRKVVRETLLLDSDGTSGVERALFNAANAAKSPGQKVFVNRGYGPAGRLSVWIVEPSEPKNSRERKGQREALQQALARVKL